MQIQHTRLRLEQKEGLELVVEVDGAVGADRLPHRAAQVRHQTAFLLKCTHLLAEHTPAVLSSPRVVTVSVKLISSADPSNFGLLHFSSSAM